jgi:hypothetical protein
MPVSSFEEPIRRLKVMKKTFPSDVILNLFQDLLPSLSMRCRNKFGMTRSFLGVTNRLALVTSLIFGFYSSLHATPKHVIIIRHAEKIPGENHINLKGFERAEALPYYFSGNPIYNNPPISYIFATALGEADSSVRPIQSCTPTSNYFNIDLEIDFKHTETRDLANELLKNPQYNGKTVLICWTHGHIRELVTAFGADDPGVWEDNIFDQVFFLTFEGTTKPKFDIFLQKLMFGDRASFQDKAPPLPPPSKKSVDEDV